MRKGLLLNAYGAGDDILGSSYTLQVRGDGPQVANFCHCRWGTVRRRAGEGDAWGTLFEESDWHPLLSHVEHLSLLMQLLRSHAITPDLCMQEVVGGKSLGQMVSEGRRATDEEVSALLQHPHTLTMRRARAHLRGAFCVAHRIMARGPAATAASCVVGSSNSQAEGCPVASHSRGTDSQASTCQVPVIALTNCTAPRPNSPLPRAAGLMLPLHP